MLTNLTFIIHCLNKARTFHCQHFATSSNCFLLENEEDKDQVVSVPSYLITPPLRLDWGGGVVSVHDFHAPALVSCEWSLPRLCQCLGEKLPVPFGWKPGWTPESPSTTYRGDKSYPYQDTLANTFSKVCL
jgi:hypothetical protein